MCYRAERQHKSVVSMLLLEQYLSTNVSAVVIVEKYQINISRRTHGLRKPSGVVERISMHS